MALAGMLNRLRRIMRHEAGHAIVELRLSDEPEWRLYV